MEVLERDFGLTDGVVHYDFVARGRERATSPCADDAEALGFLPTEDQVSQLCYGLRVVVSHARLQIPLSTCRCCGIRARP